MPASNFTRPAGFYDRPPQEAAEAAWVVTQLQKVLIRFGYHTIDTPLVEYSDLFLTKSGDDAVNRLFNFEVRGRQLCLRSEFTPSAVRLYVERYQAEPKPIRWQFSGPVFRYESPQRSHSRQFTMVGTELIGPSGISGDAETLGLAANGLLAVGLQGWTLTVGHVGLVSQMLRQFGLEPRINRALLGHMENLRRPERGRAFVEEAIQKLYAGLPEPTNELSTALQHPQEADRLMQRLLESANMGANITSRSNADIARRLMHKQNRAAQHDQVRHALDFLAALVELVGSPAQVFPAMEQLLDKLPTGNDSLKQMAQAFHATLQVLPAYQVQADQVRVEMGLARGLNYYTGIVFEIHTRAEDSQASQLCGGGRYDDFIRIMGAAQDTPAIGLAFGVERILHELHQQHKNTVNRPSVQVLVVPVEEVDNMEAARIAMVLRQQRNVELYTPPTRNLSGALARANKYAIPYVVIVGTAERQAGIVTVRDMQAGIQYTTPLDAVQLPDDPSLA